MVLAVGIPPVGCLHFCGYLIFLIYAGDQKLNVSCFTRDEVLDLSLFGSIKLLGFPVTTFAHLPPRRDASACFEISEKVLHALLVSKFKLRKCV